MSPTSLALLVALTGSSPSLKVLPKADDPRSVEVVAELNADQIGALPEGTIARQLGRKVLTFSLVNANGRPDRSMLGSYERTGTQLKFIPRFRLTAGSTYTAKLHATENSNSTLTANHSVPSFPAQTLATVTDAFPSASTLPANSLKFYIHFSQPMREGRVIFERIHLLDEHGKRVLDPWRRTELWDEDARRFTLWIHPGRVKQGVNLREDFGPVLRPGKEYILLIEQTVQSQNGQPLAQPYRKKFRTVPDDRVRPLPQKWKLTPPPAESRTPLRVEFGEPLDHALVQRCVEIRTAAGQKVACNMTLKDDESVALLTPTDPWLQANYHLIVAPILEDLAGNTPVRIFDTDLTEKTGPRPQLTIPFQLSSSQPGK